VVSSGRSKFASRVEFHSLDPIRITENVRQGLSMESAPSSEPVPSQGRVWAKPHPACSDGLYEPVLRLLQHEAATMQGDEKRKGAPSAPSWTASMGLRWLLAARKWGLRLQLFTCQAEPSDLLTGG
jgi:hypothetical protein